MLRNNLKNLSIFYKILLQFKNKTLKHYYLYSYFLVPVSISKQVPSEKRLLKKELKAINWKEVDEYHHALPVIN
jgi:hypothetical protein